MTKTQKISLTTKLLRLWKAQFIREARYMARDGTADPIWNKIVEPRWTLKKKIG